MAETNAETLFDAPTWPGHAIAYMQALCEADEKVECARVFHTTANYLASQCQSRIEAKLCVSLLAQSAKNSDAAWFVLLDGHGYRWPRLPPPDAGAVCFLQAPIGRFRADFLFVVRRPAGEAEWYVIECDGHDFHERTKHQARHDKSRDRWMTANGIKVLRFTGSEIFADSSACAAETLKAVFPGWQ